jgi:hypothetical protein
MVMGFVEHREHERVRAALKANYQILDETRVLQYQQNPDFVKQYDPSMAAFAKGETLDVSEGGLALGGFEMFRAGYKVLLKLELPGNVEELVFLAEVRWAQQYVENNLTRYRSGLKFLYLRKGDGVKLSEYLKSLPKPNPT